MQPQKKRPSAPPKFEHGISTGFHEMPIMPVRDSLEYKGGNKAVSVLMTIEKTTLNTVRFKEVVEPGQKPYIGTIYLPKTTLEYLNNCEYIYITVEGR